MAIHVRQTQRLRLPDQLAEDPPPARQVADVAPGLVVYAQIDEAFEFRAIGTQHSQRRVPRPGQVPGGLDDIFQQYLEVELGDKGGAELE